jgi:hypothetical protein
MKGVSWRGLRKRTGELAPANGVEQTPVPALTFSTPIKLNSSLKLQHVTSALRCATTARRRNLAIAKDYGMRRIISAMALLCAFVSSTEARTEHHHRSHAGRPAAWCGWYMRSQVGSDPGPEYNLARSWASLRRKCWWSHRWRYRRLETPRRQDRRPREWSMASAERQ